MKMKNNISKKLSKKLSILLKETIRCCICNKIDIKGAWVYFENHEKFYCRECQKMKFPFYYRSVYFKNKIYGEKK